MFLRAANIGDGKGLGTRLDLQLFSKPMDHWHVLTSVLQLVLDLVHCVRLSICHQRYWTIAQTGNLGGIIVQSQCKLLYLKMVVHFQQFPYWHVVAAIKLIID